MKDTIKYVGLDVSKEKIAIAIAMENLFQSLLFLMP